MSLSDIKSSSAIRKAVEEYDRLGRDHFLDRHRFGQAQQYYLVFDGKLYDSKAIVGVAHGYEFPELGPLHSKDFAGGNNTVKKKLEELGFELRIIPKQQIQTKSRQ